ncbi:hypothetical protein TrVGV298_002026 [Trichoderma virens]|nr:hypothetical protein TrVGV298_002026 [Trichoderma virens]
MSHGSRQLVIRISWISGKYPSDLDRVFVTLARPAGLSSCRKVHMIRSKKTFRLDLAPLRAGSKIVDGPAGRYDACAGVDFAPRRGASSSYPSQRHDASRELV